MLIAGAGYPGQVMVCRYGGKGWPIDCPAPAYTADFTGSAIPTGWTFTRAASSSISDQTQFDPATRTPVEYSTANTPRFRTEGLVLETIRTNYALNSFAPVTGLSATLGIRGYQVSMQGAGSVLVEATGTASSPDLPKTVTQAAPALIQTTVGGTIRLTPTGDVKRWQLEQGNNVGQPINPSTFIHTVAAAVSRNTESLYCQDAAWLQNNGYRASYVAEFIPLEWWTGGNFLMVTDKASANNTEMDRIFGVNNVPAPNNPVLRSNTFSGGAGVSGNTPDFVVANAPVNVVTRVGMVCAPDKRYACMSGSDVGWVPIIPSGRPPVLNTFGFGAFPGVTGNMPMMILRKFWYWPQELLPHQLQAVCNSGWPLP